MKDEWTKRLPNGARVRYTCLEMLRGTARVTAQLEGDAIERSEVLTGLDRLPGRTEVEGHFQDLFPGK